MIRALLLVGALAAATAGCGSATDVGSGTTSTTTAAGPGTTSPELDAETAQRLHLGAIGPDLATVPAVEAVAGQPITPVTLTAADTDSPCPTLRFGADGLPDGLELANKGDCTAEVSGTVRAAPGRYTVTYRVTDESAASDISVAVVDVRA